MPSPPTSSSLAPNTISARIWDTKYRLRTAQGVEAGIEDSWRRVAHALAAPEGDARELWAQRFYDALSDFRFLPGGRILAGAGAGKQVTLFNCFVMGPIEDSLAGIFDALKEGALTMQAGGGVGYDFSTLRPHGQAADASGGTASGPVSFMQVWDSMCATMISTSARRGAMMATLRCDHPDIEYFIDAKRDPRALRHFNLSVLVSDAFMAAVRADAPWPLAFPPPPATACVRRVVRARALWERILRAAYDSAEPGVLFIDRINQANNLYYREHITATNPCGEIPLPAYGACDLGSINLTRFVRAPFSADATLDYDGVAATTSIATRLLDNVYEVAHFPLPQQAHTARQSRRLGIGITGLADALAMLGLSYDSPDARALAQRAMQCVCHAAYRSSIALAREKGAFAQFDAERYLAAPFIRTLPQELRADIARHGIRNSHLTAIAPAGTISLLAHNVSSGLEPIFRDRYLRTVRDASGTAQPMTLEDYAYALWHQTQGERPPSAALVTLADISAPAQLEMQAALQRYVDNAISKTVSVAPDYRYEEFRALYERAYVLGLKGCTVFRPNDIRGEVLSAPADETATIPELVASDCCSPLRAAE